MTDSNTTFCFDSAVPMHEVEATLRLALLGVQALHGEDRVRLDIQADIDVTARTCTIGRTTDAGRTLAVLFQGYVRREFGDDAVDVLSPRGVLLPAEERL